MADQIKYPDYLSSVAAIPDPLEKDTNDGVKVATPDLILKDADVIDVDIMTDLIFEDIGGYELATISRHDLVNGQEVIYSPIKNLTDREYLSLLSTTKLQLKKSEHQQKILLRDKWLWYNGKMSKEKMDALGWTYDPTDGLKILKGEMDYYYNSDLDIQKSEEKIQ